MRITKNDLRNKIEFINRRLEALGYKGNYYLDVAYGSYRLVKQAGSGERIISYRMTCRELYYTLDAIENVLWYSEKKQ